MYEINGGNVMRQINQIVEEMKAGACRELLRDIYVDEGVIGYQ